MASRFPYFQLLVGGGVRGGGVGLMGWLACGPARDIWSRMGGAVKLDGGRKMYFCVFFGCYCRSWASGAGTGHWAMSPPDVSTQI